MGIGGEAGRYCWGWLCFQFEAPTCDHMSYSSTLLCIVLVCTLCICWLATWSSRNSNTTTVRKFWYFNLLLGQFTFLPFPCYHYALLTAHNVHSNVLKYGWSERFAYVSVTTQARNFKILPAVVQRPYLINVTFLTKNDFVCNMIGFVMVGHVYTLDIYN